MRNSRHFSFTDSAHKYQKLLYNLFLISNKKSNNFIEQIKSEQFIVEKNYW